MDRRKLVKPLVVIIFFLLFMNVSANKFYWYFSIWWLDMCMHFLGGFWISLVSLYIIWPKDFNIKLIFKILAIVLLVGIGWEVFELFFVNYLANNNFSLSDTSSDIFFDIFGGLCAILYLWKKKQR